MMGRYKPKDAEFNIRFFVDYNVKLLVTIGGDDTANRLSKFLKSNNLDVRNIHVPKTIDNDLPLPDRNPTFGFHSAKDEGVRIGPCTRMLVPVRIGSSCPPWVGRLVI